jgi:hypothetical protein
MFVFPFFVLFCVLAAAVVMSSSEDQDKKADVGDTSTNVASTVKSPLTQPSF